MVTERRKIQRMRRAPKRQFARLMRHIPSDAEDKFWWQVRDRRLGGFKFKRQFLIDPNIVDFVCLDAMLVVELDGSQHDKQIEYDGRRDAFLEESGFKVIRVWNRDVLTDMDGTLHRVLVALGKRPPHPNPLPLKKGERG